MRPPLDLDLTLLLVVVPACSSSDAPPAAAPVDAGADVLVAPIDAGATTDADAADAGIDCATDMAGDGLYQHLSCAGLYADILAKKVADENRAFTPGVVFWSDGAQKQRWVKLPPGATIDATSFDEWKLPVGTKLWKEFAVDGKRIETRLFAKLAAGWKHTTYRWNAAATEAERLDAGESVTIPGRDVPFEVPSTSQCDFCHAAHEEPVLGFDAVGLGLPTAQGVTLATLAAEGRFSPAAPTTTLTIPDDVTGKAAAAHGFLHANCGGCHAERLGAGAYGSIFRARLTAAQLMTATDAQTLPPYTTAYCKDTDRTNPDTGLPYKFIDGSSPSTSLTSILAHARAKPGQESVLTQMPPLVTHVPDTVGTALLDAWIAALPACQ